MFYYDFLTATKELKKDKLDTKYLYFEKKIQYSLDTQIHYSFCNDKTKMSIIHFPEYNKIKFALSIPYYLLGHNYSISLQQEFNVIEYISNILGTNLFKSNVDDIECSCVTEIPFPFINIKNSHIKISNMKTFSHQNGIFFIDSNLIHKIYDFQKNIKSKVSKSIRNELSSNTDYSCNKIYAKVENKYKRPEIALKHRGLLVEDLFNPRFIEFFKDDLLRVYRSIFKIGSISIERKNQLNTAGIILVTLKKFEKIGGYNSEKVIKETIKEFSNILTKDDQKARRAQVLLYLKKL